MAVKEAIEKSVQSLILAGVQEHFWAPRDTADVHGSAMQTYLREKTENLGIDELGRVQQARRSPLALGLSGGLQRYTGDYSSPNARLALEATLHWQASPAWSVFFHVGRGRLSAGPSNEYFNQQFDYAEAGGLLRLLPHDRLTPFVLAGGGATLRETNVGPAGFRVLPHAVVGAGLEYLATPRLGLSLRLDNHYYFSDQLDLLATGRYNDYVWGGRVGVVFYLGKLAGAHPTSR